MIFPIILMAYALVLAQGETYVVGKSTLLQFANTTSEVQRVSFVVERGVRIASVVEGSKLTVDNCNVVGRELSRAPFLCRSALQLSSLSLEGVESVGSLCECNGEASALMEECLVEDMSVRGSFLTRGVCEMERVVGSRFVNMSWVEDGKGIGEGGSAVYLGEMQDCVIEESFDSVHGGIASGISERTLGRFGCVNSTFGGVRREKGSYGVRKVRMSVEEANYDYCIFSASEHTFRDCYQEDYHHYSWTADSYDLVYSFMNCQFENCREASNGGALYFTASKDTSVEGTPYYYYTLNINTCIFTSCQATSGYSGGAVYAYYVYKATVTNSQFSKCNASSDGGSLYVHGSGSYPLTLAIESCSFSECKTGTAANYVGGAVYAAYLTTSTIKNSTFYKCEAKKWGGALYLHRKEGTLTFADTLFTDNTCSASHDIYLDRASNAASGFTADSGITITNSFSYPCRTGLTNHQSVTNTLSCLQTLQRTPIEAQGAGESTTCADTETTSCTLFSDGVSLYMTPGTHNSEILLAAGNYESSSGTYLSVGSAAVSMAPLPDAKVTFGIKKAGIDYFTVYGGSLTLQDFSIALGASLTSGKLISVTGSGSLTLSGIILSSSTTYTISSSLISVESGSATFTGVSVTGISGSGSVISCSGSSSLKITQESSFTTIDGSKSVIAFSSSGTLSITGGSSFTDITITGESADGRVVQADMRTNSTVVLDHVTFARCSGSGSGGALYLTASSYTSDTGETCYYCYTLLLNFCTFANTSASGNGGAIHALYLKKARITNCDFSSCTANSNGGACYLSGSSSTESFKLYLDNCFFSDCKSKTDSGGALWAQNLSKGSIKNCNFDDCNAGANGGALYLDRSNGILVVEGVLFTNNTASTDGFDVYLSSANNVTIYNSYTYPCRVNSVNSQDLSTELCYYTSSKSAVSIRTNERISNKTSHKEDETPDNTS